MSRKKNSLDEAFRNVLEGRVRKEEEDDMKAQAEFGDDEDEKEVKEKKKLKKEAACDDDEKKVDEEDDEEDKEEVKERRVRKEAKRLRKEEDDEEDEKKVDEEEDEDEKEIEERRRLRKEAAKRLRKEEDDEEDKEKVAERRRLRKEEDDEEDKEKVAERRRLRKEEDDEEDKEKVDEEEIPVATAGDKSADKLDKPKGQDTKEEDNEDELKAWAATQKKPELDVAEDVAAILSGAGNLSEEFRGRVQTIFEAAINTQIEKIQEFFEEEYSKRLDEEKQTIIEELAEKTDRYLDYAVKEWIKENRVAVDRGLRLELTNDFISGLKKLFEKHYVEIPEERVNLLDELAEKNEKLEHRLDEAAEREIEMKAMLAELRRDKIVAESCKDLSENQAKRLRELCEAVEYTGSKAFAEQVKTLKENYFPSKKKSLKLDEAKNVAENSKKVPVSGDGLISGAAQMLARTNRYRIVKK